MLDIKLIRTNPELVKENIKKIFEMTGVLKIIPIIEEEKENEKIV